MNRDVLREIREWRGVEQLDNPDSYNEGIRDSWMPFWVKNAAENYQLIKGDFEKENCDVGVIPKSEKPVLVIGSGPSLNEWEPYFKDWKGDIFCSSSHLAFFEAIGVKPTYCFIIDADPNMSYLVTEADTKDITLITHANMDPLVLRSWEGPRRYFRMNDPGDDWFGKYMPMMYDEFWDTKKEEEQPEDRIWNGASGQFLGMKKTWPGIKCFVLNSGNVSNTQIAISQFTGAGRPVYLCGVDLGFPVGIQKEGAIEAWNERATKIITAGQTGVVYDDEEYAEWRSVWDTWRYRFVGYKRTADGFVREDPTQIPPTRLLRLGNNGVKTDQVSCFYKYSTLILWGMDAPDVYSCSRGLLNDLLPYRSPKEVVDTQGVVEPDKRIPEIEKYSRAQEYLRHRGIYIMKGQGKHWKKEVTKDRFLKSKKRIIKWMLFTSRFKKQKMTKKQIIHGMMKAPMVKFRLKWFEWTFTPTERVRTILGYIGITNRYHVKGWNRVVLVLRFYTGRLLKLW